jgi:hypothetical protein
LGTISAANIFDFVTQTIDVLTLSYRRTEKPEIPVPTKVSLGHQKRKEEFSPSASVVTAWSTWAGRVPAVSERTGQ